MAATRKIYVYANGVGLTINISEDDNSLDLELALSVAEHFRLKNVEASEIIEQVKKAVGNRRKFADEMKISRAEQMRMESAFVN